MINKKDEADSLSRSFSLGVAVARSASETISPEKDKIVLSHLERDVKIEGDIRLNQLIVGSLRKNSTYAVLSEEEDFFFEDRSNGEYFWIVDPLDGSVNFSRGIPLCCISIALWKGMQPVFGIIHDFFHDEVFTGMIGKGAWLNGLPIQVGNILQMHEAVLCTGFPVKDDFSKTSLSDFVMAIQKYKKVRLLGSAALSLAWVGSGRADVYQENNIAIWDVAAGIAFVSAAGGRVSFNAGSVANRLMVKASNRFLLPHV